MWARHSPQHILYGFDYTYRLTEMSTPETIMPFDPQLYNRRPSRPEMRRAPGHAHGPSLSEDDKMGLVLLIVAILAFGAYTLVVFTGIMGGS